MTSDFRDGESFISKMLRKVFSRIRVKIILFLVSFLLILTAARLISVEIPVQDISKKAAFSYIDERHFTSLPFGSQSHWLQPWRAYLETVPVKTFLDGTGINFNLHGSQNPELIAKMLSKYGIRRARIEIGWGDLESDDEGKLKSYKEAGFRDQLLALKKYGIRPLILLNAHHGAPGPLQSFERTLTLDAPAGSTKIQLSDVSNLKVGYTGLSNVTDYWAAEILITEISANNIVTLSKPLPNDIPARTNVSMATLKYRPFTPPETKDYQETMAGWQNYVGTVSKFVSEVLETTQSSDKGFDMEVWNELTFGSNFLYINKYYDQPLYEYNQDDIWRNLVAKTAEYVDAHPQAFEGVLFSNGFANTIPWPASSEQPERINAISKHPYASRKHYPRDEYHTTPVNAVFQSEEKGAFSPPNYSAFFPEYYGTALQTETLVRDMGPLPSEIYGTQHGPKARVRNGVVIPTSVWITEVNINPGEDDSSITVERALAVKAKTTARYFCFFLNKGANQLFLYDTTGGDKGYGIVRQKFLDYASQPTVYPADDDAYTSPALRTLGHIVAKMSDKADPYLATTRQLEVVSISDNHDHFQFAGDGTQSHPNLYNRDVFAFLPFQANAQRFVIPYYVMTRDVMQDLVPEQYTIQIQGLQGEGALVTAYDPINDKIIPVTIMGCDQNSLSLQLTATDYPYLLTIQETKR